MAVSMLPTKPPSARTITPTGQQPRPAQTAQTPPYAPPVQMGGDPAAREPAWMAGGNSPDRGPAPAPAPAQPMFGTPQNVGGSDVGFSEYNIWGPQQQQQMRGNLEKMFGGASQTLGGLGGSAGLQGVMKNLSLIHI